MESLLRAAPPEPSFAGGHLAEIIGLAERFRVPGVYPYRDWAANGGLFSYGTDRWGLYRRAASYVDRILEGDRPGDLPVQTPTKFELVINRKTAKAVGLIVPQSILARAGEVIEREFQYVGDEIAAPWPMDPAVDEGAHRGDHVTAHPERKRVERTIEDRRRDIAVAPGSARIAF
jgi:hypothetical protein